MDVVIEQNLRITPGENHRFIAQNRSKCALRRQGKVFYKAVQPPVRFVHLNFDQYHGASVKSLHNAADIPVKLVFDQACDNRSAANSLVDTQQLKGLDVLWVVDARDRFSDVKAFFCNLANDKVFLVIACHRGNNISPQNPRIL
ncbi:hypothetical protein SDC9_160915 [bioreactor metagenome]|uniref:Uncharacterized protein n=1 Tax=bioreactor metagenome TaxID=1076179 RepID=A0A645FN18_9ZZZZ